MSTSIAIGSSYLQKAGIITLAAFLLTASMTVLAAAESTATTTQEQRTSRSLHFATGGRANDRDSQKGSQSSDLYGEMTTGETRAKTTSKLADDSGAMASFESRSFDFWIYDADVILFADEDHDGFYYGIDLLFDADTIYSSADVYAAVYLSYEGGPWNEYAVTEEFTLFGSSSNDDYVLVTELMSGYPTGDYDLLIELFDAVDGAFVASFGPEDSSELSFIPLEDFNRDAPVVETRITVSHGGGGALGIWMLLVLLAGRAISNRRI